MFGYLQLFSYIYFLRKYLAIIFHFQPYFFIVYLWLCDQCDSKRKQVQVPNIVFFLFWVTNQKLARGGGIPFWDQKSRRKMLDSI